MSDQEIAQALRRAWSRAGRSKRAADAGLKNGRVNPKTFSFRTARIPGYVLFPYDGSRVMRIQ